MKSLIDFLQESKRSTNVQYIFSPKTPKDCRTAFKKLDKWVQDNNYLYFVTCSDYPGTEVEGWGSNLEEVLNNNYISIDDQYVDLQQHPGGSIETIGCDTYRGCLELYVYTGINSTVPVTVYILSGDTAKIFMDEVSGCRNSSNSTSFNDNPESLFAKYSTVSLKKFENIVSAKKNLANFSASEIKNILK